MKPIAFLLAILMALTSTGADAATKKKSKTKLNKTTQTSQKYVIAIGYPNADAALSGIKARSVLLLKPMPGLLVGSSAVTRGLWPMKILILNGHLPNLATMRTQAWLNV